SILLHHPGPATDPALSAPEAPPPPQAPPRLRPGPPRRNRLLPHSPPPARAPYGPDLPPHLVRTHTPGAGRRIGSHRVPGLGLDGFLLLLITANTRLIILTNDKRIQRQRTLRPLPNAMPLHTKPDTPEREAYRDEADRFYDDPQLFMATELWPAAEARSSPESDSEPAAAAAAAASSSAPPEDIPRYIVGFEGIEPWLHDFFSSPHGAGHNLGVSPKRVWSGWNGFFNEDARRRGKLVVWDTGLYTTVS
ncbi:Alg9-like mannosyltransferase, partial [Colletotrichum limetticola]